MTAERFAARLRVFPAVADRDACERFTRAHGAALAHHHMDGLSSQSPDWYDDPLAQVVVLEEPDGGLLAGMRVQIAHAARGLPTEKAFRRTGEVSDYVTRHRADGIGEVCGAWADPRLAKSPVFPFVSCAGFSLLTRLGARRALLSCSVYSQRVLLDLGLVVETSLGDAGKFYYPTPTNLSFFMVLHDTDAFAGARADYREIIFDLRARPRQRRVLESPSVVAEVDVDLTVPAPS